jgi:hypothetical protein
MIKTGERQRKDVEYYEGTKTTATGTYVGGIFIFASFMGRKVRGPGKLMIFLLSCF